jgi:hypothetical protein
VSPKATPPDDDPEQPVIFDSARLVSVNEIHVHPSNPRKGNLEVIKASLEEHGQYRPIVVQLSSGDILAGNHTFMAVLELGWTQISAVFVDVDDERAKKILLVDNRSSEMGSFDADSLMELLADLRETEAGLVGTGYDDGYVDELMASLELPDPLNFNTESNDGKHVSGDTMVWGFLQWKRTRVEITPEEVQLLDDALETYLDEKGTPAGFGFYVTDPLPKRERKDPPEGFEGELIDGHAHDAEQAAVEEALAAMGDDE